MLKLRSFVLLVCFAQIGLARVSTKAETKEDYWPNGRVKSSEKWAKGKREGKARYFYDTGVLQSEIVWHDGKQNSHYRIFWPDGKPAQEVSFKNGLKEGKFRWFYHSGNIRTEEEYVNDVLTGVAKNYFKSGKVHSEQNFEKGQVNGVSRWFSEDSRLKAELNYQNGLLAGIQKWYAEDGSETVLSYRAGRPVTKPNPIKVSVTTSSEMSQWMSWVYGGAELIATVIVLGVIFRIRRRKKKGKWDSRTVISEEPQTGFVVAAPQVIRKFRFEILAASVLGVVVALAGIFISYLIQLDSANPSRGSVGEPMELIGAAVVFGFLVAMAFIRNSLKERKLCLRCKGREFVIGKTSLQCCIGLFEGEARRTLRRKQLAYMEIPWRDLAEFIVAPPKKSPAYYKLKFKGDQKYVYILRKYFHGKEEQIIEQIRLHASCPITVNDAIQSSSEDTVTQFRKAA